MNRLTVAWIVALLAVFASPSFAVCSFDHTLENSDQEELLCIDTNQDGDIEPGEDCCLTGTVGQDPPPAQQGQVSTGEPACLNANQSDASDQMEIVGCGDRTTYTGDVTPTTVNLTGAHGAGIPGFDGVFLDGGGSSSATTSGTAGAPVQVTEVEVSTSPGSGVIGEGRLCAANGGPALEIVDKVGMTYVTRLTPLTSDSVNYLCALAPIPLVGGGMDLFNVCTPVNAMGNSVISVVNAAVDPTTEFPFAEALPPCSGSHMAPTVGHFGLIALALLLLGGGTLLLRRSPSFAAGLPGA